MLWCENSCIAPLIGCVHMPTISIAWKRISKVTLAAHPFTEPCRCLREFCWCLIQPEHLSSGFGAASKSPLPRPYLGRVKLRDQNLMLRSHLFEFGDLAKDSAHDSLLKQPFKVYLDGHVLLCVLMGWDCGWGPGGAAVLRLM